MAFLRQMQCANVNMNCITSQRQHKLRMQQCLFQHIQSGNSIAALAAAELPVLPSLSESFGNAAVEAVAAGVPVLLMDTFGIVPTIHERAGLAVPLGEESLARGLRMMMHNAGQVASLTNRREEAVKELSWEEPLNEMEQIYRSLLGKEK